MEFNWKWDGIAPPLLDQTVDQGLEPGWREAIEGPWEKLRCIKILRQFRCLAPKSFLEPLELHLILARFHHSISLAGRDPSTHCGTKLDRPSEVASRPGFRTVSEMAALTSEMFTWPKRRNLKAKTYYILWIFSRPKAWNLIGFGLEISNARGLR